jgi:hypothetical protein
LAAVARLVYNILQIYIAWRSPVEEKYIGTKRKAYWKLVGNNFFHIFIINTLFPLKQ